MLHSQPAHSGTNQPKDTANVFFTSTERADIPMCLI